MDRQERGHPRCRRKHPGPKLPPGLLGGVIQKDRDRSGNVVKVRAGALFVRLGAIKDRVAGLAIGTTVNTSHMERLSGTMRCQSARLARRPRCVSRDGHRLQWSPWPWRDLYNRARAHGSLEGRTPAKAMGLRERARWVEEYAGHPDHVDELTRAIWAEERKEALTSALNRQNPRRAIAAS